MKSGRDEREKTEDSKKGQGVCKKCVGGRDHYLGREKANEQAGGSREFEPEIKALREKKIDILGNTTNILTGRSLE